MKSIADKINTANKVLILTHQKPDGDALGSVLALFSYLKKQEKEVEAVVTDIPDFAKVFPGYENLKTKVSIDYDLVILVDVSFGGQLGIFAHHANDQEKLIIIDHHNVEIDQKIMQVIDNEASSATMLVYDFFKQNNILITKDIATCLYGGLLTDTGGFQYQNSTKRAFDMAGDLITLGVNHSSLYSNLIKPEYKLDYLLLKKEVIEHLEIINEKIAFSYLDYETLQKYDVNEAKTFVNVGRNIAGVEVSIFIIEEEKSKYRVSLRSKRYLDVSVIANKFGGGGHKHASGIRSILPFDELKTLILTEIEEKLI